ncbi:uncharacterized protein LOC143349286 isoform X2 [Colletes latitarsis]|uniref:uncharacterized protein LOC143349286 isoform X2 n=1 Tax=Colletes latitarsis TaxID=2605962 RepID=UPI0040352E81
MDVLRVSILLLMVVACSTSTLKNDREASFGSGRNYIRRSRRIALNEYLVPPPPPRHHPVRSGRVANPQPTEAPGYFSKFMDWINPFGYGSPSPQHSKSPPNLEPSFSPQSHPPPFNVHPGSPSGPSLQPPPGPPPGLPLYPPPGPQPNLPLYPPLSPPPSLHSVPILTPPSQHPGVGIAPLGPPPGQHSGSIVPPLGPPPGPYSGSLAPPLSTHPVLPPHPSSLPIYNAPPLALLDVRPFVLPPKNNQYLPPNKGKPCNPCNKFPWIPMQDGGLRPDVYLPPQLSNGYLPPAVQAHHDAQHAASHEVRIPDFSHAQAHQNGQQGVVGSLPNPQLYTGPMPPLYKAEPFNRPSSPHTENVAHLEPPPLPVVPSTGQHANPQIDNERFNIRDNHDLTSSGTQINQGHASVVPQNHETEINEQFEDHKESFGIAIPDNQPPISDQGQDGILNHPVLDNQQVITSFGSSGVENQGFSDQDNDFNYLPPNAFHDQSVEHLNYQYSDDLSPSSSVVKDSHAVTQAPPASSPSTNKDPVHFEESPLLDLTQKSESRTDKQWPPPTATYIDNTAKTTANYNLQTSNALTDDSPSFTKPIETYSASNIQNGDGVSTPLAVDFSEHRYIETSTSNSRYTGFSWPSLSLDVANSKNESFENGTFVDPLVRWRNSSREVQNSEQGRLDSNDSVQRQQNVKRNKQVQVIIPYTSEYTPIPFQQSYGDWSVKNNHERTQSRKAPPSRDTSDNYVQQESRNEIRLINQLQTQFNLNDSNKLSVKQSDARPATTRTNNSIDVRRLQKNIDNWTIQEYSKFTTSSTVLPSSLHPYLLPSKKIPTEYLTTTEPGDHTNESNDKNESVKTYSLAGFSFNEVEHEGSASNHIEESRAKVVRIESSKSTTSISESTDKSTTNEKSTWDGYSVLISPVNKERVYVVTPQPVPSTSAKSKLDKQKANEDRTNSSNSKKSEESLSEFEAIEKAYQVLPQAVNNLAVASTGKEDVPLWGIMEHEEFASLNLDESGDESAGDILDGPVLYSGHSKVSRAKR